MDEPQNKLLYNEAIQHFNEPVLLHLSVGRLIGYAETAVDCYWIVSEPRKEIFWSSCVGGLIYLSALKEQGLVHASNGEVWTDYSRIDSWLESNGAPKAQAFVLTLRHDDEELRPYELLEKECKHDDL